MIKGDYKIVNFNGAALSGTAVEMSGIYDQIVDNYDKTIMVSGVILNEKLQNDAFASVSDTEDSVILTVYGGTITVTEDDEVTFATAKSNTELTSEIEDLQDMVPARNVFSDSWNGITFTLYQLGGKGEGSLVFGQLSGQVAENLPSAWTTIFSDLKSSDLGFNRTLFCRTFSNVGHGFGLQIDNVGTKVAGSSVLQSEFIQTGIIFG